MPAATDFGFVADEDFGFVPDPDDSAFGFVPDEPSPETASEAPNQPTVGELQGLSNAFQRGLARFSQTRALGAAEMAERESELIREQAPSPVSPLEGVSDPLFDAETAKGAAVSRIAEQERKAQSLPPSEGLREFQTSDNWFSAFVKNPVEITASIIAESLPQMAPSMAAGVAGNVVGGPVAGAIGVGAGSYASEKASATLDAIKEQGVDISDEQQLSEFLSNPEKVKAAKEIATARAVPVATFDALTAGLAGRFLRQALGKSALKTAAAIGGEAVMQAAGGSAGEAVAQLASKGEIASGRDIAMEAIAEIASGAPEAASNLRSLPAEKPVDTEATRAASDELALKPLAQPKPLSAAETAGAVDRASGQPPLKSAEPMEAAATESALERIASEKAPEPIPVGGETAPKEGITVEDSPASTIPTDSPSMGDFFDVITEEGRVRSAARFSIPFWQKTSGETERVNDAWNPEDAPRKMVRAVARAGDRWVEGWLKPNGSFVFDQSGIRPTWNEASFGLRERSVGSEKALEEYKAINSKESKSLTDAAPRQLSSSTKEPVKSDYEQYQEVQGKINELMENGRAFDENGDTTPEFNDLWKQNEVIKNRNEGRVPDAPKPDAAPPKPDEGEFPTGIKNEITDQDRARWGLPEASPVERRESEALLRSAEEKIKNDPDAGNRLVTELSKEPRPLTNEENALLLHRKLQVQRGFDAAKSEMEAAKTPEAREQAAEKLKQYSDDMLNVLTAARTSGTKLGQGLQSRQLLVNEDFSLASMVARKRAEKGGGELSAKESKQIEELHQKIKDSEKRIAELEAENTKLGTVDQFDKALKEAKKEGRKARTPNALVQFLDAKAEKARARIIARRGRLNFGFDPSAWVDEAIIGASHIARGVSDFAAWSKQMVSEFGERISPHLKDIFSKSQEYHDAAAPKKPLPEQLLARDKAAVKRRTAEYERKAREGDFETRKKRIKQIDEELLQLQFENQKAKERYWQGLIEDRMKRRVAARKVFDVGIETLNTTRALLTSADLSAVLRQGGFITLGNPVRASKSLIPMFRALMSEKGQFAVEKSIQDRPNAKSGLYDQSGLYLAKEGGSLSKMEEAYMSRWIAKLPRWSLVGPMARASQRAYTTFLNKLRADSFDALVKAYSSDGRTLPPEQAKALANYINFATGRGSLGGGRFEATASGLNTLFFAPRFVASRFQLLSQPFLGFRSGGKADLRTRRLIAQEYGKFLIGAAVVYGLASQAGGEIENDPRSSDFGKIKFGNTRIDPMGGLIQSTVLLSRLISGKTKSLSGKLNPIRETDGQKIPFGRGDSFDVMARFARTKFSPLLGFGADAFSGRDMIGQKVTPLSAAKRMVIPISLQDIQKTLKEQGVPKGTIISLLSIFGWGVQNYSTPEQADSKVGLAR